MNNTEKQFIEILSKAIRNDNNIEKFENVNWINLASLASDHKIEGIIYCAIKDTENFLNADKSVIDELKSTAFYTGIDQFRKIAYLDKVFEEFNKNNIQVIALKGLILRNLYPEPDQRSMCDADILVKVNDLEKVKKVLLAIGYELHDENEKHHLKFYHRIYPMIEVHWELIDGKVVDTHIWNNTVRDKLINTEIETLSYEDFLLHLCHHMAHHMSGMGFGLRQVADLVLFVESYRDIIDWNNFKKKSKKQGIEKFTLIMFALSNRLFNMEVPEELYDKDIINSSYIDVLIEDIILGGVYGRSNNEKMLANSISINMNSNDDNPVISMMKKIKNVLNPNDETLVGKYHYANKYKVLKPIAGVQQIYNSRFNEDYGFIDNIKFISRGIRMYKDRNNLRKWLDL